jgi:heavy metal sensor kinase
MAAALDSDACPASPALLDLAGEFHRVVCRRVAGSDGTEYEVLVALSVADRLAAWRQALWEHALLALGLILLVSLVTYFAIRRAFWPVRQLINTARTITAEDLSRRVDASGDRYEIGELAATLNDVIARLEAAFEREKRFSGDVAHELNTPLTVLRGEIELALRKQRSAKGYQETLRHLLAEVDRLNEIVANLLFLSRADARDLPAQMDSVALDDVVLTAYEQLQPMARERSLRFELEEVAEVRVRGDAELLERLVANLLSNAIKFTPDKGEVAVALRTQDGHFTLTVVDDGPGIPDEDLARIFERFYRVDKSRSKRTGGAGLGLAIVKEIASAHGFDVQALNRPRAGAELRVVGATRRE